MRRAKGLLINILMLFVTCLICIIMIEVFIRIFYPQTLVPFAGYDRILGWGNVPSTSAVQSNKDYKVIVNINSKGMRDKEYSYEKPKGVLRILVLGDSFTWGAGVENNETFSKFLENILDTNVEVINAGVNGYGTDQEYLFLTTKGYKYRPDIVLLAFCLNDIENNMLDFDGSSRIPKPRFLLGEDSIRLTNVPVPRIGKNRGIISSFKAFLGSHFHLYSILRNIRNHLKYKYYSRLKEKLLRSRDHLEKPQNSRRTLKFLNDGESIYFPFLKRWTNFGIEGWNLTQKILTNMDAFSKDIGAEFIVILIPYAAEIYESNWENDISRYELNLRNYDLSKPSEIFTTFGIENNIKIILLSDPFKEYIGERLYFIHDSHWTKYGHRLAAKEIYKFLIRNQIIQTETDY